VIGSPTGSGAKTAKGVTYHSFFGIMKDYKMLCVDGVQEAALLLELDRRAPIARRLANVLVLLLDEIKLQ